MSHIVYKIYMYKYMVCIYGFLVRLLDLARNP